MRDLEKWQLEVLARMYGVPVVKQSRQKAERTYWAVREWLLRRVVESTDKGN